MIFRCCAGRSHALVYNASSQSRRLKAIEDGDMRPISLCLFLIVACLAILASPSYGYYVYGGSSELSYKQNVEDVPIGREKRQVENFDDDYAPTANQQAQDEPGFWDRVVKVALKLFSKFVEWLNS